MTEPGSSTNPPAAGGGPAPEALAQARRLRDEALTLERAVAAAADNTARRESGAPRPPTRKDLEALRQARFGAGAGSVRVDADLATGVTTVVYVDADGKEIGSGPFRPDGGPTPPAAPVAPSGPGSPTPPGAGPESPPAIEAEAEPRGRRR